MCGRKKMTSKKTFVSSSDAERYQCFVCYDGICNPIELECHHRMCSACWTKWCTTKTTVSSVPVCPYCKRVSKPTQLDAKWLEELQHKTVNCPMQSMGCTWEGTYKDADVHVYNCNFRSDKCPALCGLMVCRSKMDAHLSEFHTQEKSNQMKPSPSIHLGEKWYGKDTIQPKKENTQISEDLTTTGVWFPIRSGDGVEGMWIARLCTPKSKHTWIGFRPSGVHHARERGMFTWTSTQKDKEVYAAGIAVDKLWTLWNNQRVWSNPLFQAAWENISPLIRASRQAFWDIHHPQNPSIASFSLLFQQWVKTQ